MTETVTPDEFIDLDAPPDPPEALELSVRPTVRPTGAGSRLIAGTDLSIVPADHEMGMLAQMAVTVSAADTAPKALRGKPNDVFMVLLTARDLGIGLTTALRECHVIDGKVTLSPKVKLAMVHQQGMGRVFQHQAPRVSPDGEPVRCPCGTDAPGNDDESATWHAERKDLPGVIHTSTFTMAMARRVSGLTTKNTWKQYPQRMLNARALGYLVDDVFPEVGAGLYSPDEMGAVTDEDGNPVIDVMATAEPVPGTRAPRAMEARRAQEAAPDATDEQRAALKARTDVLAAGAKLALTELWTAGLDEGNPSLPPLRLLKASQVAKAEAMVASIEAREAKGEWSLPDEPEFDVDGDGQTDAAGDVVRPVLVAPVDQGELDGTEPF